MQKFMAAMKRKMFFGTVSNPNWCLHFVPSTIAQWNYGMKMAEIGVSWMAMVLALVYLVWWLASTLILHLRQWLYGEKIMFVWMLIVMYLDVQIGR